MKKIRNPNPILYTIFYIIINPILKLLFKLQIKKNNYTIPTKGSIVLCNHVSYIDFLLVMVALYPIKLNALVAKRYFNEPVLNWILTQMGCIPKNLFDSDLAATSQIIKLLKNDNNVLIFPEGRCSVDGTYQGVNIATSKLIKRMNKPVITVHVDGPFLAIPFWRKRFKFAKFRANVTTAIAGDDTSNLTLEQIANIIGAGLSGELNVNMPPVYNFFANNLSVGLENVLYICPNCKSTFENKSDGCNLTCNKCGNTVTMDKYGKLISINNSVTWDSVHNWQKQQILNEIENIKNIGVFETPTKLTIVSSENVNKNLEGIVKLDKTGWTFIGSGEELFFPLENVPAIPFDANEDFQIYSNGCIYFFKPTPAILSARFAILGECMYKMYATKVAMTDPLDLPLNIYR